MPAWLDTTLIVGAIAGTATLIGVAMRWGSRLVIVERNQESANANINEIKANNREQTLMTQRIMEDMHIIQAGMEQFKEFKENFKILKHDMTELKYDIKSEIKSELHAELKVVNHSLNNIKLNQNTLSEAAKQMWDKQAQATLDLAEMKQQISYLQKEKKVG